MSNETETRGDHRIIVDLCSGEPFEINDFTQSFAAIARMYERNYRTDDRDAPKLYITRLETGSILAEIAPCWDVAAVGTAVTMMDGGVIVSDFVNRIWRGIRAFSTPSGAETTLRIDAPPLDDARDIREFTKPLVGKSGATLGIKHARFEKGEGHTIVEHRFDESELNMASINIEKVSAELILTHVAPNEAPQEESSKPLDEVMLFFHQASRDPGKASGRTVDRGIIPTVSSKPLPVYFRKNFQDLKTKMIQGDVNPLTNAFVVDVYVQYIDGLPKGYIVANVHGVLPIDDGDES